MRISGKTKLLGVMGWPVEHSLSPALHNRAIEGLGLDYAYLALPVRPESLREAIAGMRAAGFVGLSVTIPHKEAALAFVDEVSEEAKIIGAINTVLFKGDRTLGYNTDSYGFSQSLKIDAGVEVRGKTVTVIGSGGVSRAISTACVLNEANSLNMTDIVKERCTNLCGQLAQLDTNTKIRDVYPEDMTLARAVDESDIVINATPLGMQSDDPMPIPAASIHPKCLVFDAVYNVAETPLMREAKKKGCRTLSGLGMLAYQGACAFRIWTGVRPNVDEMKESLREALVGPSEP